MGKQTMKRIDIKDAFRNYLDSKGYKYTNNNVEDLIDAYLDCVESIEEMTIINMYDWIKHTSEVERLLG